MSAFDPLRTLVAVCRGSALTSRESLYREFVKSTIPRRGGERTKVICKRGVCDERSSFKQRKSNAFGTKFTLHKR